MGRSWGALGGRHEAPYHGVPNALRPVSVLGGSRRAISDVRPSGPGMRPLRSNQFRHVTMMDKDFSPIDAASLVAWFVWAEANATRLRRRLDDLGADWQDPAPKHVPWGPKSDPAVRRTGWTVTTRRRPLQDPEIGTAGVGAGPTVVRDSSIPHECGMHTSFPHYALSRSRLRTRSTMTPDWPK
jgi:hypothetical protein